jgi:serine/threonine protein kinase
MSAVPGVNSLIGKCMYLNFFILFYVYLDLVKEELHHGGMGLAYVVDDPDVGGEAVLKLIPLGAKNSEARVQNQIIIEREIKVGILIAKECPQLVSYSETFEWGDYFCIKMEYCKVGDLQNRLKSGYVFSEEVQFFFLFAFLLFE